MAGARDLCLCVFVQCAGGGSGVVLRSLLVGGFDTTAKRALFVGVATSQRLSVCVFVQCACDVNVGTKSGLPAGWLPNNPVTNDDNCDVGPLGRG